MGFGEVIKIGKMGYSMKGMNEFGAVCVKGT